MKVDQIRSIENLQRENLSPIEECILIQKLAANLPDTMDDGNPSRDEHGSLTD
jgi:ParB-like chromosome segregation protein Spo0J